MFHPVKEALNQLVKLPKLPIRYFVRHKPFPKLVTQAQAVSSPITDSYSLTKYRTLPLKFSQATAALRAYSLVDKDEYVNLKLDLNLFDKNKRKQVVQIVSSVLLFPHQFTDESTVFVLCGDEETEVAKESGAKGYLEQRNFSKLESLEAQYDHYIATETVADAVRQYSRVFKNKLPNRRRGNIVKPELLKECVHRFLATTMLSFTRSTADKTQALLSMDFGKVSLTPWSPTVYSHSLTICLLYW